ncbi:hypothetical protein [Amycolatopsis pittospori]|uniref:hypothetical protein n=1 Tax=Amycolatopsis pittospori TaxID=2749434 RepID=UPI001F3322F6|nr:hypothetical protein [Amycolatopsis pittospori]
MGFGFGLSLQGPAELAGPERAGRRIRTVITAPESGATATTAAIRYPAAAFTFTWSQDIGRYLIGWTTRR